MNKIIINQIIIENLVLQNSHFLKFLLILLHFKQIRFLTLLEKH